MKHAPLPTQICVGGDAFEINRKSTPSAHVHLGVGGIGGKAGPIAKLGHIAYRAWKIAP
jgi:hypothetical protein